MMTVGFLASKLGLNFEKKKQNQNLLESIKQADLLCIVQPTGTTVRMDRDSRPIQREPSSSNVMKSSGADPAAPRLY